MLLSRLILGLCLLCYGALGAAPTYTTIFRYNNMCDSTNLDANIGAMKEGTVMHVSTADTNQLGSVFLSSRVNVRDGFRATFTFQMKDVTGGGGDGLAFVIHNLSPQSYGDDSFNIGYGSMSNTVALEFDTFKNSDIGDPNDNHYAFHVPATQGGIVYATETNQPHAAKQSSVAFKDGVAHEAIVEYDPTATTLTVSIDGKESHTFGPTPAVNLSALLNLEGGRDAYVGFTAASGEAYESHTILSVKFESAAAGATCVSGFSLPDCTVTPGAGGDCGMYKSCVQCTSATICCGWCGDGDGTCSPQTASSSCPLIYSCSAGSNHTVLWWGIGIVLGVLVLCGIALFVYWRRTRIRRRTTDPSLLPGDSLDTAGDERTYTYAQL